MAFANIEDLVEMVNKMSFIDNNGTKHKDIIINNYIFKYTRTNKNLTFYYKCRVKNCETRKECTASCTIETESTLNIVQANLLHCHEAVSEIELDVKYFQRENKSRAGQSMETIQKIF